MAIDASTGNIGIGTRQPTSDAKLHVIGNIRLTGTVNPPDYVFEADYNLRPIDEVESFVIENKHLPGIPSAEEIKEECILIADMFNKHLEKIEELTLYVIQLKKENQALKEARQNETEDIKKRLATVEAK